MTKTQPSKTNAVVLMMLMSALYYQAHSQTNIPKYEFGLHLNSFIYQGDLTPERLGSFKTMRWGINLFGSRIMSPSFSLRTNLAIGGLRGDDALYDEPEYRKQRNFNFNTRVIELTQLIVWNPLRTNYRDKGFSPYLFSGIGFNFVKIKRDWSNFNGEYFDADYLEKFALDTAHSVPKNIPVIPIGAGFRYDISPRLAVSAEASYRLTFTDYLDGFSEAANPNRKDNYYTIGVGIIYRAGKKNMLNCPVVRY